jgi:threonine aldolase
MIDFRSDTVTRPTQEMLAYMMQAPVGDDVFSDDPTVNELEAYAANMFGMEASVFCPSGTMTNQIAIKVHTRSMDEVICEEGAHVYFYEAGGIAFNSGASVRLLKGDRGRFTAQQVAENINADNVHFPRTSLVCIENTCNRGGGSYYTIPQLQPIKNVCEQHQLKLHLDGARLFNALVATNESPLAYGKIFDSISICLSKGLGAPVGSLLLGRKDFIKEARRVRKVFGGGMRQAGIIAAGGLYALQHNINRLKTDHEHAALIGNALQQHLGVKEVWPVETNIIIFKLEENEHAQSLLNLFNEQGILYHLVAKNAVRLVTHLDITAAMVQQVVQLLSK